LPPKNKLPATNSRNITILLLTIGTYGKIPMEDKITKFTAALGKVRYP
jgi:hypothetical protein